MVMRRPRYLLLFAALAGCHSQQAQHEPDGKASNRMAASVGCIGRILPEEGTFFIGLSTSGGLMPVITDVRIQPGDEVLRGQIVATLSTRGILEGAVREAQARLELARARLGRVKAGAEPAETAVAKAEIARLEEQRKTALIDLERNRPLLAKGYIPKARLDALEASVRNTDELLHQARERLNGIGNVRPEDVAIAEKEINVAEAELARARQDAADTNVRARANGRVLRVLAHPGEPVGPQGIAELADTSRMVVMAEVYESDIARVHKGQKATITSDLLPTPITGRVVWIGSNIERQEQFSTEPGTPSDSRIFRVRIEPSEQGILAQRINGKVDVVIEP